jgi:hypothetical protein
MGAWLLSGHAGGRSARSVGRPHRRRVVSIQDLGSLGELVGGIAVVVSLVYLALQIRQNTRQVEQNTRSIQRESTRAFLEDATAWRGYLIESPEITELYRRAMRKPDDLEPGEWLRFRMLMDNLFEHWRFGFFTRSDAESWALLPEYIIRRTLAEPGGQRYWETVREQLPQDEFVRYIDQLTSDGGTD